MPNPNRSRRPAGMCLRPIGVIHTPFMHPGGTPIQPRMARGAQGAVEVFEQFRDALKDLEGFERIWLLYWFHRVSETRLQVIPYLDEVERGLFATRAPCRPNPIGMSAVRLLRVEGNVLQVADLDILDGTPLLDIKPYGRQFDCFRVTRCGWLDNVATGRRVADDRFHQRGAPKPKRSLPAQRGKP